MRTRDEASAGDTIGVSPLSRRRLLGGAAFAAAALAARPAPPTVARPARALGQGLSGSITVSFPDELGKKPPYVEQAAEAVRQANPNAEVAVDHQKIGAGDFYTKTLLALDAGDAADVLHLPGDRLGELAAAGYVAPLDPFVSEWPDWQFYPDSIKGGVTYQEQIFAIPYGLDTRFLYARRDRLEQAGLPRDWQPANVAAILEAARAVQAGVPDAIPYALYAGTAGDSGTANHAFVPLLWAFGGRLQDDAGKWLATDPAVQETLAYYEQAFRTDQLVPAEVLTTTKPWTAMREKLGNGELALLFEGGWVYGGWQSNDPAGTAENIAYLLHPTEDAGPSFTIGGTGMVWYVNAASEHPDLAWEFVKAFNNPETVARLNIEDPHPVARTDAAALPEFQEQPFLVASTDSLAQARFVPNDPNYGKVVEVIQRATGRVAAGEATPQEAAERYAEDLARAVGEENVAG